MTQLTINTGVTPNDKSADSLYSAFNKVNANFTELYGLVSIHLADDLTGTIPAEVLANSTVYVGTTPVTLNRSSGELLLTGVIIDGLSPISSGNNPPNSPSDNQLWYDSTGGRLYIYYSNTWVDTNPEANHSGGSVTTMSDTPPSAPNQGDLWFDTTGGRLYIRYSNDWVDTNPNPN